MARKLILASELTSSLPKIRDEVGPVMEGARLLLVPTAAHSEGWMPEYGSHVLPFEQMGFSVDVLGLEGMEPKETAATLATANAVYVCGGNTFYLLEHMRKSGFSHLVPHFVDDGLLYIGSSAGAVVTAPDIGYAAGLDDPSKASLDDHAGLNLVDFAVLPHMDHPDMGPAVRSLYFDGPGKGTMFLGLSDAQVAVVEGRSFRIV